MLRNRKEKKIKQKKKSLIDFLNKFNKFAQ